MAGISGVVSIASTLYAFAALVGNGTVYAWGAAEYGGKGSGVPAQLAAVGVVSLQASAYAFAALRADGSVVCWGDELAGGDCSSIQLSGVKAIYSTGGAFAATTAAVAVSACW